MNKICTSLKQSKKLIELGIDANTADMFWDVSEPLERIVPTVGSISDYYDMEDWAIPCWSLSALMELMNRNCYNVSLNCHGAEWNVKFDDSEKYKAFTKDYAVDACYEMIIWLKENKKI